MGNKPADEKLFARTSCTKWITTKNRSYLFWANCRKPIKGTSNTWVHYGYKKNIICGIGLRLYLECKRPKQRKICKYVYWDRGNRTYVSWAIFAFWHGATGSRQCHRGLEPHQRLPIQRHIAFGVFTTEIEWNRHWRNGQHFVATL